MFDKENLIRTAYAAFNARDIERALSVMHPDVDWANGMEGGRVHGHENVREYWTRQWSQIDPRVVPRHVQVEKDGRVIVEVHQVVRDLTGAVLADQTVHHVYEFDGDLVRRMEIK